MGRVARSSDLVSVIVLLSGLTGLAVWGPGLLRAMRGMIVLLLSAPGGASGESVWLVKEGWVAISPVARSAVPIIILPVVSGIIANLLQFGVILSVDPIKPNLERILPSAGMSRIFSVRSIVRGSLGVAKIAAVGVVLLLVIRAFSERILSAAFTGPGGLIRESGTMVRGIVLRALVGLGILALIDWGYQRWAYRADLRITRRELLDDLRRMEGDAKTAKRRRRMGEQLVTQDLGLKIRGTALLLANARGSVIALGEYASGKGFRVVGRQDPGPARRILALARQYGVPVVIEGDLVLDVARRCRDGDELPPDLSRRAKKLIVDTRGTLEGEHCEDLGG